MAECTFLEFAQGLAAMSVAGVKRDFGMEPPKSLSDAMLPAKFLRLPRGDRAPFADCIDKGSGMMTIEVIVCISPVIQGMPERNFIETVRMMDAVSYAAVNLDVAMSVPTVVVKQIIFTVDVRYWAVSVEVTARG